MLAVRATGLLILGSLMAASAAYGRQTAAGQAPGAAERGVVAVLPLQSDQVAAETLTGIEFGILDQIDELPGFQPLSPRDVAAALQRASFDLEACVRELNCLARAGRRVKASLVVEVLVSSLGGELTISARAVDTRTGTELARLAEPLHSDLQSRLWQLHRLVVQLLVPGSYVGTLIIQCSEKQAEVYVDDHLLGLTPLPPLAPFKAGVHILRISKEGFADINHFVDVEYNRTSTVHVSLQNNTLNVDLTQVMPAAGLGALFIVAEQPGLEVRVDGEPLGITPLSAPLTSIPAGKRRVTLRAPGQPAVVLEVPIVSGQRTDLALDSGSSAMDLRILGVVSASAALPGLREVRQLPAPPPPPPEPLAFPSWRFYSGAISGGLGIAALLVGSHYASNARQYFNEAQQLTQALDAGVDSLDERIAMGDRLRTLNAQGPRAVTLEKVSFAAAAVLLGAGAGLVLWDMWRSSPTEGEAPLRVGLLPPVGAGEASAGQGTPWRLWLEGAW
jgi:hypothetical protein